MSDAIEAHHAIFDPQAVWEDYPNVRRSPDLPALHRHADLMAFLDELMEEAGDLFAREVLVESAEGRGIPHLTFGEGETTVLIWARQHGDEDLCSAAVMDFLGYLSDRRDTALVRTIRENLTLHIVPMVNPDGVERHTRRNAQGLDPNRDARLRQSGGGRLLRKIFERHQPEICFNLHDQSPRKSTDTTGDLIALSLQASPFDPEESPGENLIRAKRICALIEVAMRPWIEGHIARYEADYMPRAFGDSMSRWGLASVLIESGGWFGPPGEADAFITRCHFTALLSGVAAIASGAEKAADPANYDRLPLEGRDHFDLVVRDALILDGSGIRPHSGDISLNHSVNHRGGGVWSGSIRDVGDLHIFRGKAEIEGAELIATPGLICLDPTFTPAALEDGDRTRGYLRRGITTVIGLQEGEGEGESHEHSPTTDSPLRAVFLERGRDLAVADANSFLTDAPAMWFRWPRVTPDALGPLDPALEEIESDQSLDLVMVNQGRPSRNRALILLGPPSGETAVSPDFETLRTVFPNRKIAEVITSAPADSLPDTLLMAPDSSEPTLDAILRDLSEADDRAQDDWVAALTDELSSAIGLRVGGLIRGGQRGDIVLWQRAAGSSDEPDAIRLGPLQRVIIAGRVVELD
jgi:hypothetical protein